MIALTLALAAATGGVGIRIEEVGEVAISEAVRLAEQLREAIEKRTGRRVVIDEPSWRCDRPDRCADELRVRTGSEEILFLRIFGGPKRTLVLAERTRREGPPVAARMLFPPDRASWLDSIEELTRRLFSARAPPPAVVEAVRLPPLDDRPPEPPPAKLLPWLLLAGGVAVTAAGVGFGASAAAAGGDISQEPLRAEQYEPLAHRQRAHGITSLVLVPIGLVAIASGVLVFFLQ